MYDSFDVFKTDALACGVTAYPDASLQPQQIAAAYRIYQNAKQGTKLRDADDQVIAFGVTIVGRLALKVKSPPKNGEEEYVWLPADESFPSIDKIMQENLRTMDEEADQTGSILDAKNWSLLANDAWLLGGIHAKTEFHFASPLSWSNLWDQEATRMTVTAREVIGITAHGYQISKPNPKLEAVAVCMNWGKAKSASLMTFKDQIQRYSGLNALLQFYQALPSELTEGS